MKMFYVIFLNDYINEFVKFNEFWRQNRCNSCDLNIIHVVQFWYFS